MTLARRQVLTGGAALLLTAAGLPRRTLAETSPAIAALDRSQLIYLTPVVSDGRESACHGEVWFVHHLGDVFVVTKSDAWRTEALRRGFRRAKIWIGEFGAWKSAGDKYRSAPYLEIEGRLEDDPSVHADVLSRFGEKYSGEWASWGPRFENGLADGSRVLLRYQVVA